MPAGFAEVSTVFRWHGALALCAEWAVRVEDRCDGRNEPVPDARGWVRRREFYAALCTAARSRTLSSHTLALIIVDLKALACRWADD